MLPGLSGEELLPKIKDIPVIVVSAKADVTDKVELLLNGAADYITKPFDIQELLARIAVQLRKKNTSPSVISFGNITLYADTLTVKLGESQIYFDVHYIYVVMLLFVFPCNNIQGEL